MEGRKEVASSSSSSFTSDLFGSKDSSGSSSSGIFGSIFAPSSKVAGWESLHPQVGEKQQDSKSGTPDIIPRSSEWRKTSILILRVPRVLCPRLSVKMGEKMILAVLLEEIGGKGPSTIKSSPPMTGEFFMYSPRVTWI
ncbi:hypothetical protein F0562_016263 [Nyssa sinensis]|uniref:Uncharacterized protein n=1 Tax=Nyssa sinensis TaxID=561372 RepID=A0A5J4ZJM4_9ASTE|nr:hypothetical protein F0562_016263 [Nyssa sinensis]